MVKKLLKLAVLAGIATAVAKKLQSGSAAPAGGGWQSSYDPAPAPTAPTPPAPTDAPQNTAATAAAEAGDDVPPPPVDIPPAKTDVDPLTDPLPEDDEQA